MERGEEEWKGWTTTYKMTDCLVAESLLCLSFLDPPATHTRSVPVMNVCPSTPHPLHCPPARLSTAALHTHFKTVFFLQAREARQKEGRSGT